MDAARECVLYSLMPFLVFQATQSLETKSLRNIWHRDQIPIPRLIVDLKNVNRTWKRWKQEFISQHRSHG